MRLSKLFDSACVQETDSSRWRPVGVSDACLCFQTFESFTVYWKVPNLSVYVCFCLGLLENPAKTSFSLLLAGLRWSLLVSFQFMNVNFYLPTILSVLL